MSEKITYQSTQETECAGCGKRKHTPLRRDEMGGYVCLTCIDKRLDKYDTGIELIAIERDRQISAEGWSASHDDEHDSCELSDAAACYMTTAALQVMGGCGPEDCQDHWPFDGEWWKPSDDPIRNLVKAGALIAAEIDRLHRAMEDAPSHYNNEETARALREGGVSLKEENATCPSTGATGNNHE